MARAPSAESADIRILDLAAEHIRQHGIERTTVVAIAREAAMSHGNVYRYFPSKEALVDAVTAQWLKPIETGVRDIDKTRIYIDLAEARSLLRKPTGATFLQISLHDPKRAREEAAHMEEVLRHSVRPWQEREKEWLSVFRALSVSSAITVTVFTLIASLAMFNTLAMIVLEKTKDIAILRSMGYERRDITRIFLWQAAIVLAIGAIVGGIFGAAVSWGVSLVPLPINTLFKTEHFIVALSPWHFVQAITTAVVMVMIASLVPARRAARLEPGDIVRGTAQ